MAKREEPWRQKHRQLYREIHAAKGLTQRERDNLIHTHSKLGVFVDEELAELRKQVERLKGKLS